MPNFTMPKRTIVQCGIAALVSVALISGVRIRPLGIFFLAVFCFWFYKTRCNLRIIPPPELEKKYEQLTEFVGALRRDRPTMFCAIATASLGALAVLGHLVSGSTVVLIIFVLAAIISTKYNFKLIKLQPKDYAWSEKLTPNYEAEMDDEFMPEVNETNLFVLERASDLASITSPTENIEEEDKSDEIPSELLITDVIPEVSENSTDDDDDDDLTPAKMKKGHSKAIVAAGGGGAQSGSDAIEFKKGHFKRDSSLSTTSSSSEESLSKGLQFPDHTVVDGPRLRELPPAATVGEMSPQQQASELVAEAVKTQLLPKLMSGLVQWSMGGGASAGTGAGASGSGNTVVAQQPATATASTQRRVVTALDSSDESDFEILDNDDFK